MKTRGMVVLMGVGGFGIRHLEGLLTAQKPLSIHVVDRSPEALEAAQKIPVGIHEVSYVSEIPLLDHVDVAIIATTSGVRAAATRELLKRTKKLRYLVLEKILFDKKADYASIGALLKKRGVKTWVNSPVPLFPFHKSLVRSGAPVLCHIVGGARFGLMTNIIHYAHFASFLAGSVPTSCDATLLDAHILESKRKGFLELSGTLVLKFKNGSKLIATTLPMDLPRRTIVVGKDIRAQIDEAKGVAQIAKRSTKWQWKEVLAPFLKQSEMTGSIVEEILKKGICGLPTYADSAALHLVILEAVRKFLKKEGVRSLADYPFT